MSGMSEVMGSLAVLRRHRHTAEIMHQVQYRMVPLFSGVSSPSTSLRYIRGGCCPAIPTESESYPAIFP